ncbi:hypothetical protein FOZ62_002948 [Perkinsus olseni]|uniref:Uncharacterized protein n=1 Tax=Perkinsus olseni TaxID=32597 RepID=A0A7J6TP00_PEROL|nr:hypothetical protein FOZ62_002948 [Perkinsus olseni]
MELSTAARSIARFDNPRGMLEQCGTVINRYLEARITTPARGQPSPYPHQERSTKTALNWEEKGTRVTLLLANLEQTGTSKTIG